MQGTKLPKVTHRCSLGCFFRGGRLNISVSPYVTSLLRKVNLKIALSLWKGIKCFSSALRRRNLETLHWRQKDLSTPSRVSVNHPIILTLPFSPRSTKTSEIFETWISNWYQYPEIVFPKIEPFNRRFRNFWEESQMEQKKINFLTSSKSLKVVVLFSGNSENCYHSISSLEISGNPNRNFHRMAGAQYVPQGRFHD